MRSLELVAFCVGTQTRWNSGAQGSGGGFRTLDFGEVFTSVIVIKEIGI